MKRIKKKGKTTVQTRKISSPKLLQQFSPVGRLIRRSSHFGSQAGSATKEPANEEKNASMNVDVTTNTSGSHNSETALHVIPAQPHQRQLSASNVVKKELVSKKSHFFQEAAQQSVSWVIEEAKDHVDSIIFCQCGRICKEAFNLCEECIAAGKVLEAGGYLYLKRDQNNLDRYWFQLVNKELYCMRLCLIIDRLQKQGRQGVRVNDKYQWIPDRRRGRCENRHEIHDLSVLAVHKMGQKDTLFFEGGGKETMGWIYSQCPLLFRHIQDIRSGGTCENIHEA